MIKVLIVDDQGLLRDTLREALSREEGILVCGTTDSAASAIEQATDHCPDVLVINVETIGEACFRAIRRIRSQCPLTKFILLTDHIRDTHVDHALCMGVEGFLAKSAGGSCIVHAVREATAGRITFSPEVMSRLVSRNDDAHPDKRAKTRLSNLSQRERQLLRFLAVGLRVRPKTLFCHSSALRQQMMALAN